MTPYEISNLVVSIVSALFVGISVLYLAKKLKSSIAIHSDTHEWNRRIATSEAIEKVRQLDTDTLNIKFEHINRREPIPLKEITDAFNDDPALRLSLNKLLNCYEGLANGIYTGTYDELTIKVNRRGAMERELMRFREFIQHRQQQGNK